ncbi:DUF3181 family protein [Oscillatoria sp. CS-180]|uniref:DUF3181 family protein n=1 Tax=Oscillatoria sp. CS-180 TaxID=3021720 RepID=UPI00232B5E9A|nr:DUF3181 family protein [Oscillatoria sp. CS-180]MDB9526636.1 DUF3181 family protein [Oscillatoria sp. CS-180]
MSYSASAETIETLAANIGEVVYMDVAKWHLYLNDAKLHTLVAQRLYPMVEDDRISESEIAKVLQDIPIPLGAGRKQLPLMDLIPASCMGDLVRVLEDFKDKI